MIAGAALREMVTSVVPKDFYDSLRSMIPELDSIELPVQHIFSLFREKEAFVAKIEKLTCLALRTQQKGLPLAKRRQTRDLALSLNQKRALYLIAAACGYYDALRYLNAALIISFLDVLVQNDDYDQLKDILIQLKKGGCTDIIKRIYIWTIENTHLIILSILCELYEGKYEDEVNELFISSVVEGNSTVIEKILTAHRINLKIVESAFLSADNEGNYEGISTLLDYRYIVSDVTIIETLSLILKSLTIDENFAQIKVLLKDNPYVRNMVKYKMISYAAHNNIPRAVNFWVTLYPELTDNTIVKNYLKTYMTEADNQDIATPVYGEEHNISRAFTAQYQNQCQQTSSISSADVVKDNKENVNEDLSIAFKSLGL